jgi:hypothetical protein
MSAEMKAVPSSRSVRAEIQTGGDRKRSIEPRQRWVQ